MGIDFSRQILRTKVGPRTVRIKHISNGRRPITYSNESEGANRDIYVDFKLEKKPLVSMVCTRIFSALGLTLISAKPLLDTLTANHG